MGRGCTTKGREDTDLDFLDLYIGLPNLRKIEDEVA